MTSRSQPERPVLVELDNVRLEAQLGVPEDASGVVIFAHGSGSGRMSPRNRSVASRLREAGVGTLLLDLLTEHEEQRDEITGELRFDIPFLADRVHGATQWVLNAPDLQGLTVGYFGASTGAAAALVAAAGRQNPAAVVSRGGRPDLATDSLPKVTAPTLLIVGGQDKGVLELNRQAAESMTAAAEVKVEVVPGASHLFSEPGALEQVADLAAQWFSRYL